MIFLRFPYTRRSRRFTIGLISMGDKSLVADGITDALCLPCCA